jgi:hypothetical protein
MAIPMAHWYTINCFGHDKINSNSGRVLLFHFAFYLCSVHEINDNGTIQSTAWVVTTHQCLCQLVGHFSSRRRVGFGN